MGHVDRWEIHEPVGKSRCGVVHSLSTIQTGQTGQTGQTMDNREHTRQKGEKRAAGDQVQNQEKKSERERRTLHSASRPCPLPIVKPQSQNDNGQKKLSYHESIQPVHRTVVFNDEVSSKAPAPRPPFHIHRPSVYPCSERQSRQTTPHVPHCPGRIRTCSAATCLRNQTNQCSSRKPLFV